MLGVLRDRGLVGDDPSEREIVEALHRYVMATPSVLVGVSLADAVGERRAQNQPGTDQEYPNWKVPLADSSGRWCWSRTCSPTSGCARWRPCSTADEMAEQLRRVRVVGNSGSGQDDVRARGSPRGSACRTSSSTRCSGTPAGPSGTRTEARALIADFVASSDRGWVTDGNWTAGTAGLLDRRRRLRVARLPAPHRHAAGDPPDAARGLLRTELWHGNREDLRNLLSRDPDQNVVLWSWTAHAPYRAAVHGARRRVADPRGPPAQPPRGAPLAGGALRRRAGRTGRDKAFDAARPNADRPALPEECGPVGLGVRRGGGPPPARPARGARRRGTRAPGGAARRGRPGARRATRRWRRARRPRVVGQVGRVQPDDDVLRHLVGLVGPHPLEAREVRLDERHEQRAVVHAAEAADRRGLERVRQLVLVDHGGPGRGLGLGASGRRRGRRRRRADRWPSRRRPAARRCRSRRRGRRRRAT